MLRNILLLCCLSAFCLTTICCQRKDGTLTYQLVDPCEGCEAIFESGDRVLSSLDTMPFYAQGQKQIRISGRVYKSDGKTPAAGVILYLYQTDETGVYKAKPGAKGWERRHGSIRTWIKTDQDGRYTFFTFQPAVYPSGTEPAHIHLTVLEPDGRYYWLDSYFFEGDPLLERTNLDLEAIRGGGVCILQLSEKNGLFVANRDIILGENIPGYLK